MLVIGLWITLCRRKPSSKESIWMSDCSTHIPLSIDSGQLNDFNWNCSFKDLASIFAPTNKARDGSYIISWDTIAENLTLFFRYQRCPTLRYALHCTLLLTEHWSYICSKIFFWGNISSYDSTCTISDLTNSSGHLSCNRLLWTWKFTVQYAVDPDTWGWNQKKMKESHTNRWRHWLGELYGITFFP